MAERKITDGTRVVLTDGTQTVNIFKSINPYTDETPGVWSPDATDVKNQARSNRLVPSVFAGIAARMQAMADLPFAVYSLKGDKELDNSDSYKNTIGFMPDPARFMSLSEGALTVAGKGYWFKQNGERSKNVKSLRYWLPSSVTLDEEKAKKGKIEFKRQGVNDKNYTAEEVLYMWLDDPEVELGPPLVWPLAAALIPAEANGAINKWVADYMKRGAVKAMLLMVEGAWPAGEVDRVEGWFNKFMTGARGLVWKVFNGAGVKPTIVGDGLEALKDLGISKELRYEIHQALGTRHLLEDENLATATVRERQFYTVTVVPDARKIQHALNDQILNGMGFHLEFEPERLEIFQENEGEQAQAFGELFNIFKEVMTPEAAFELAAEKLDYQFTDEQKVKIQKGITEKGKEKPVEVQPEEKPLNPETVRALVELDKWRAKVEKAGKMVTWHAVDLKPDMVKAIRSGEMTFEQAREKIHPASEMLFAPDVQAQAIKELAEAINRVAS